MLQAEGTVQTEYSALRRPAQGVTGVNERGRSRGHPGSQAVRSGRFQAKEAGTLFYSR